MPTDAPPLDAPRFAYTGDAALEPEVLRALRRVVDPEMAVSIVELGLVYAVAVADDAVHARITMTSPACPVTELIVEDVVHELGKALDRSVEVEVVWDPPWTPERMSERARKALEGE
ncbi:hypothetical protein BWI17_21650 [Betaproteobacteria bacterium GR16-43]|nr:hypothetical protein BWI17_21650 [Betaproteobacteria bacterium GR16-43]